MIIDAHKLKLLRTFIGTIALGFAPIVEAQAQSLAWIWQTDLDTGVNVQIFVEGTGSDSVTALLPMGPPPPTGLGAMFELFAEGTAWDKTGPLSPYWLATKFVNAYSPEATVNVVAEDQRLLSDGTFVQRTRADRPFSVEVHVAGLVDGSPDPVEQNVIFYAEGKNYDLLTYSGLRENPYELSESFLGNGDPVLGPQYHELTAATPILGCGEQVFMIDRQAADGVPRKTLVQDRIEIWPVATAALSSDPDDTTQTIAGNVYEDKIPPLFLTMLHLYPDSYTYAQVYPGPEVLGTVGTIVGGTERRFGTFYNPGPEPTIVPQDDDVTLDDLSLYAAADGIWTFEVITATPFDSRAPERLMHVTFEVDRVITTRGQLSVREDTNP